MALPATPYNVYLITAERLQQLIDAKTLGTRMDLVRVVQDIEKDILELQTGAATVTEDSLVPITLTIDDAP